MHDCGLSHGASSPPSYSGQFPEFSLRLSSSVMMMFSMSFIVRWSRKAWNSTCFSSSRDSCCMSNCRDGDRDQCRGPVIHTQIRGTIQTCTTSSLNPQVKSIIWHHSRAPLSFNGGVLAPLHPCYLWTSESVCKPAWEHKHGPIDLSKYEQFDGYTN